MKTAQEILLELAKINVEIRAWCNTQETPEDNYEEPYKMLVSLSHEISHVLKFHLKRGETK